MKLYKTDEELGEMYQEPVGWGFYLAIIFVSLVIAVTIADMLGFVDVFINSFA